MRAAPALAVLGIALASAACDSRHVSLGDGRGTASSVRDGGAPSFGEPTLIQGLESSDSGETTDDDPSLTGDLKELYFDSKRGGGAGREDIWSTARDATTSPWAAPHFEATLSSDSRETGIALTADGLVLYFSSDREGGAGGLDVYVSTRSSRQDDWSTPRRVESLESSGDDLVSAVDPTGNTLHLARRDGEDDDYDLYVALRLEGTAAEAFLDPTPIAELVSDDEESDAFPVQGGLGLVFTRDENLLLAVRATPTDAYGEPSPLTDLNSDADDRDAWSTPALDYVVFSSDRTGDYRLYEARR